MKVENNDANALKESDIKHVYGDFYRGQDYFDDEGQVHQVKISKKEKRSVFWETPLTYYST